MKKLCLVALASVLAASTPAWSVEPVHTADIAKRNLTPGDFPMMKQLAPNVYAYTDTLNAGDATITTDSLVVVTTGGVVVIDGQDSEAQGKAMVAAIAKITAQPVKYMVIASDHIDHVGANAVFKAAFPGIVFISSPVSQKVLATNPNPPTETVAEKRTLHLGDTDIEILNIGRGHTGGDLVAYLPQTKVLFMGELYLHWVFPAFITAYPSEWVATIKKAQAMDVAWYVPGHGFVDDAATLKADLNDSLKATEYVIAEAKRLHGLGFACESEKNCPAAEKANWGPYKDWTLFKSQSARALARVYMEIDGKLPK